MTNQLMLNLLDEMDEEAQNMSAVMGAASSVAAASFPPSTSQIVFPGVLRGAYDWNKCYMEELHLMDDDIFYGHMRMSKAVFSALCSKLDPVMNKASEEVAHTGGEKKMDTRASLTITLWYLVNKTTFREVGNLFGYHRTAVNRKFHETVLSLADALADQLKWPENFGDVAAGFSKIAGFPGVVGAIYGTHFKVIAPAQEQVSYNSRKQVHTVGALAVVDEQLRFLYAFIGYPGSIADQRALDNCSLGLAVKSSPNDYVPSNNCHLIGDKAFTLQVNMMTPYKETGSLTHTRVSYNKKHSQTRQVVEDAFGLLKVKFRSLLSLEVELDKAPGIIRVCFLLHNFILNHTLPDRLGLATNDLIVGNLNAAEKRSFLASYLQRLQRN